MVMQVCQMILDGPDVTQERSANLLTQRLALPD